MHENYISLDLHCGLTQEISIEDTYWTEITAGLKHKMSQEKIDIEIAENIRPKNPKLDNNHPQTIRTKKC